MKNWKIKFIFENTWNSGKDSAIIVAKTDELAIKKLVKQYDGSILGISSVEEMSEQDLIKETKFLVDYLRWNNYLRTLSYKA
jgi:hypothetical protein